MYANVNNRKITPVLPDVLVIRLTILTIGGIKWKKSSVVVML